MLLSVLSLAVAPQRRISTVSAPYISTAAGPITLPMQADAAFRAWPALNDEATRRSVNAGRRYRLHLREDALDADADPTLSLFSGDTLMGRFALALAQRKAVDRKEFFEACEFFARVRSHLQADTGVRTLYDIAGGHGLVGTLAAMLKRDEFERVVVADPRRPKAFDAVVGAAVDVAPWVEGRVVHEQSKVGPRAPLPRGCAVACVHGCRGLTDKIIAAAAEADARSVALMPCCYQQTAAHAPDALRGALGVPLAADVHRTYRLEQLGYAVIWRAIPPSITPMNRILLAHRPDTSPVRDDRG